MFRVSKGHWREPKVIRTCPRHDLRMSEPKRKRLVRRRNLEEWGRGRGEIYAWLRAHHKDIRKLKVGDDKPWAELLLDLRADLADSASADRISLNNVLNMWARVCRDVENEPPYRFKNYPSRMPKDWKPPLVSVSQPAPEPEAAPVPITPGSLIRQPPPRGPGMSLLEKLTGKPDLIRSEPVQDCERDVDAEIAAMRLEMRKRSV